jgi:hypothetical protein
LIIGFIFLKSLFHHLVFFTHAKDDDLQAQPFDSIAHLKHTLFSALIGYYIVQPIADSPPCCPF